MNGPTENYDGSGDAGVGEGVEDQRAGDTVQIEDVADAVGCAATDNFVGSAEDVGAANVVDSAGEAAAANYDVTIGDVGVTGFVDVDAPGDGGAVGCDELIANLSSAHIDDDEIREVLICYYIKTCKLLMEYDEFLESGLPVEVSPEDFAVARNSLISVMDLYWNLLN